MQGSSAPGKSSPPCRLSTANTTSKTIPIRMGTPAHDTIRAKMRSTTTCAQPPINHVKCVAPSAAADICAVLTTPDKGRCTSTHAVAHKHLNRWQAPAESRRRQCSSAGCQRKTMHGNRCIHTCMHVSLPEESLLYPAHCTQAEMVLLLLMKK